MKKDAGSAAAVPHRARKPALESGLLARHEAVLLDMDGTLVDTETLWFTVERKVAARFGAAVPAAAAAELHGLDTAALARTLRQRYGLSVDNDTFITALHAEVLARLPEAHARAGAASLVSRLAALDTPRAVVSNSSSAVVAATLAPHAWARVLPLRFSVDDVERGKPEPDLYLHAADALALDPRRCLVIEDSPTGALAAVRAGMTCIAVTFGQTPSSAFANLTPHVVASLAAAEEMLLARG